MNGEAWCPWGRKESDMTERLYFYFLLIQTILCQDKILSLQTYQVNNLFPLALPNSSYLVQFPFVSFYCS